MNAIVEITPKLSKLIPLLASDQSGEVVSAAAAIGRTLQSVGCDFHDLVKALGTPSRPADAKASETPKDWGDWGSRGDWSRTSYVDMAEFCCEHREALKPHEAEFVREMRLKLHFGSAFCMSPKQRNWLEILHSKLRRRYA